MAPKSSSSGTKKKSTSSSSSDGTKAPKFKLPSEFIARPNVIKNGNNKDLATVIVHPDVLKELEINFGSMCIVSKIGNNGIVAIAKAGDEKTHPLNVLKLTTTLRAVGNIILGDRLEIRKIVSQPTYATSVTVGSIQGIDLTKYDNVSKKINKLLDDCGIVMPGMIFKKIDINSGKEGKPNNVDLLVVGINEDELPDVSKLEINDYDNEDEYDEAEDEYDEAEDENINEEQLGNDTFYLSPPGIYRSNNTKLILTKETNCNPKYNLPESLSYNLVGGLNKEIEILKNAIELPLHKPKLFSRFGVSPPRGILLHGPPGTGKTMLLRCVANNSNAHVLTINGPSIVSKYLGETESSLRDFFNEAKKYQPSIIFIDEIDSIAPNRSSDDSGEVESRVVATLLTLMDGMGNSGRVVVVGATNRPNSIDSALRRPGRFDQEIEIGIPDVDGRKDILLKQFHKMSSERHSLSDEDIQSIASKTHGYVGADLSALCRESVMKAIQRGMIDPKGSNDLKVELHDIENAMVDVRPSAMREIFLEMPKVYWSDIGGQEELKQKMKEMIQLPLEASETFNKLGVTAPKGVLLYGPPGCSKTLTAKALATESGINFFAVKGPEIFNKYVGESERAIREIFRKARAASPSIIFFDEIDAISSSREGGSGSDVSNHVLTSLLNEIDGVEELNGVVIVAATNRPDEIDPALLRPGRLDRHLYVGPPDFNARLQIIKKCTIKFGSEIQNDEPFLRELSAKTGGCSGAEVVLLCQEAGLSAIMADYQVDKVGKHHFQNALEGLSRGITEDMLGYYQQFASRSGVSV
ncbi:hypothetical protein TBLA_0A06380 [Henningerozyma blattae CBS 6284]|uniref:AAA+ ATPase domain-containing protein n=1 Tax=Henningerozyma blattae (strain ATCC 34711 / CBS 6284 / DSM 70876 / NBRC 10599 / NRRL Y-10934 / UCD 77-7) TaxID=1071380 RepID=I2GWC7_HENB6|nr:hypothetical protein TBLA_0A06380 [Tetrapisispora blattae CBS 6284]CCH58429.1 hypothetical protein TBLA_0A06380 [Tetrapisispora blattae CBS 6284]